MPISIFKRGTKEQINIQEEFNIWNLLRSRYLSIETLKLLSNFVHDRDFSLLINSSLTHTKKHAQLLEKEIEKFQIEAPDRPPAEYVTSAQVNVITDSLIFRLIYNGSVAQLFNLMSALRSTTSNDRLRKVISDDLKQHLQDFQRLYKYGKLKGWQVDPPAYKTSKPVKNEALSVSEAFHIWDNLSYRYQQIRLTQFFQGFAHDVEFSAKLTLGLENLQAEVEALEKEAAKQEIALPERPPVSVSVASDPETMHDKFMYAMVLRGIQDSLDLHVRATTETIRNDSIRDLFMGFWEKELTLYEGFLKYGKAKGWLQSPPVNQT